MKWCDGDVPMYSVCSDGCGAEGEERCANADSGACASSVYDHCHGYSWALQVQGSSTRAVCRDGVQYSLHYYSSDCSGDIAQENQESSSCYGVPIEEGQVGYVAGAEFTTCSDNAETTEGKDKKIEDLKK